MKNFDYILYDGKICILTEHREKSSSIAGIMMPATGDSYFVFEVDVPNNKIEKCDSIVSEKSIIHRLKKWRIEHGEIFNFIEYEMSLIHQFVKK